MPEPTGQSPLPDPATQPAELKRRQRNATAAGLVTFVAVILLCFQTSNATLKSYSFFVAAVPGLIVYLLVGLRGVKRPPR